MKGKKPSSIDVAKKAGVSRTTVSFVLNNIHGKSIPEETRQKVLKAVSELNYKANQGARDLVMTRYYSIGLFVSHTQSLCSDAYIIRLIEGMTPVLNKNRIQLVLQPFKLNERDYLKIIEKENFDGVIMLNVHDDNKGLDEIVKSGCPVVVIGTISDKDIPQVDIDNLKASIEVVNYLIGLGHKNIGMILHASLAFHASKVRFEGYKFALEKAGIKIRDQWVKVGNFSEESGYKAMQEILMQKERPTAIFSGNDIIAYGAIQAIKDANLRIPEDISIVGFDDDYLSRYLNPPLTTVTLPVVGLGSEAVGAIINLIKKKKKKRENNILLPTHLTIRKSCMELR